MLFSKIVHASTTTIMFILYYRSRTMTQYTLTYNSQLQCCSGYGPKPNCLRKFYLLMNTEHNNITKCICSNLQFPMW